MYRRAVSIVFPSDALQHEALRNIIVDERFITSEEVEKPDVHRDLTQGFSIREPWLFQTDPRNHLACLYDEDMLGHYGGLKNKLVELGYGFDEFDHGIYQGVNRAVRFWRPGLPSPLMAIMDQEGNFVIRASAFTDPSCQRAYQVAQTSSWMHAFEYDAAAAALLAPLVFQNMPL